MEYLALIYADETAWEGFSDDTRNAMYEQYSEFSPRCGRRRRARRRRGARADGVRDDRPRCARVASS